MTITRGDPRAEFAIGLHMADKCSRVAKIRLHPCLYLHMGRTECVSEFMADPDFGDWLLFIDDDLQFSQAALDTIIATCDSGVGHIIGGVYWSPLSGTSDPTSDVWPVVMSFSPGERESHLRDTFVHRPYPRKWVANQPPAQPFPVDAIGTGFMAISRVCLQAMYDHYPQPLPWFGLDVIDEVAVGEDLAFCYRAAQLGFQTWAVNMPAPEDLLHIKLIKCRRPTFKD